MALTTNQLIVGMFNMASGGYNSLVSDYITANGDVAAADALLQFTGLNPQFAGTNVYSDADFASALVARVMPGLSASLQTSITSIVTNFITANPALSRGAVVVALINAVEAIPASDPVLGTAGAAFDSRVALADASTSTSVDFTELQTEVGGSAIDSGSTFTLTTGADNIVGTSGDDVIGGVNTAAASQFTAVDSIDGGAGVDTLKLDLNAAYTGGASIKNIEKIQLTQGGGTFNATGITGLTDIIFNAGVASTGTGFSGVSGLANVTSMNRAANTIVTYADTAVSGSADEVTLTLHNNTGDTVNLNSATALGAGIETVNIVSEGLANTATLASNDTTVTKVTIAGDQNLTLTLGGNVQTSAAIIDGSAATGALTIDGFGAVANTVTGGSANDTFTFGTQFTSADKVDGGAGSNTLGVTTSATRGSINAAEWANVQNVQTVAFTHSGVAAEDVSQNAALLTGVTAYRLVGSGAGSEDFSFTNVANETTFNARNAVDNVALTLADATGLNDSLTLSLGVATTGTVSSVASLAGVTGLETLNIQALAPSNATTHTIGTTASAAKHVVTGDANLTISAATAATAIDASGLNAALNLGGVTAYAVVDGNVRSGAGNDTLTAGAGNQTLNGGAGNDIITGGVGQDVLTGGAGADVFQYGAAGTVVDAAGANVDRITDFTAGTDKIALLTTANNTVGDILAGVTFDTATAAMAAPLAELQSGTAVANIAAVYTQLDAVLAGAAEFAASAANGTATVARVVEFTSGAAAGKYLVINDNAAGFDAATDIVINVTGLTGTIGASDFSFI